MATHRAYLRKEDAGGAIHVAHEALHRRESILYTARDNELTIAPLQCALNGGKLQRKWLITNAVVANERADGRAWACKGVEERDDP